MTDRPPSRDDAPSRGGALRLHGMIARDIGVAIIGGVYRPGQTLDGEIAASGNLQVSRSAYREAVRILAAKGLVVSRPKTGTQVSPRANWHMLDPDVLTWMFVREVDEELLASLFELRRIVEPEGAALAAARRTTAQLNGMRAALDAMRQHSLGTEEGRAADQAFHALLLEASANAFLVSLTSGVGAAVSWTTVFKQRASPLRRDPLPDHERVLEAVANADPAAARAAMTQLVDLAFLDTKTAPRPGGAQSNGPSG